MSKSNPNAEQAQVTNPLQSLDQALSLFEFYENKGFADKQQMMSLVTWLTAFVFALIAFCITKIYGDEQFDETTVFLAGLAAVALSLYAIYITYEFLDHAEKNYSKADKIRCDKAFPLELDNLLSFEKKETIFLQCIRKLLGWKHVGRVFIVLFGWTVFVWAISLCTIYVIT